jgi:hypothetical protein
MYTYFNISGLFLDWFRDYLSGRYQKVVIHGQKSQCKEVTSGVPQGSILGPLLFFINDMPSELCFSTAALFADECKIFIEVKSQIDCLK